MLRQLSVVLVFLLSLVVNFLSTDLPLNGLTPQELSALYKVYIIPADYVFSIWAYIYVGLTLFVVAQALPLRRENPRFTSVGLLFILTCVLNATWLVLWHFQFVAISVIVMLALLGVLIQIYLKLYPSYSSANLIEKTTLDWPFRLYLSWIIVATITNITAFLDHLNYDGTPFTPELWTGIMLVLASIIGLSFLVKLGDIIPSLVLMWSLYGIHLKFPNIEMVGNTALALTILLGLSVILWSLKLLFPRSPGKELA